MVVKNILVDLTQIQGCIALGINLNATVEFVIQNYRSRRHRTESLITIDEEILKLRAQGLNEEDDVVLWKGKGDVFRPCFDTRETWNSIRVQQPKVQWYKGLCFLGLNTKILCHVLDRSTQSLGNRRYDAAMEFSETIWRNLTRKLLGQNYSHVWGQILVLLSTNTVSGVKRFLLRYVFQLSIHTIWLERNGRKHSRVQRPLSFLIKFIDKQTKNRISSLQGRGGTSFKNAMMVWFSSRD
ncbi:uncharacterized protein LOC108838979 [Raphanus sativus]|uniref:Uncharacterized protein LOC108838979 n=1 Tax=Raphanus sativus TaxID=3726 RepID=A0A9W3CHH6_RAPSA|nr:uncharacterized protein LOC108838979 [Raphanus sativus]